MGSPPDGISGGGLQHRWRRDTAQLDVLLPDGIGERAAARTGGTGSPTLPTPGGTQALHRSQPVEITAEGRVGSVLHPILVGALIAKAAARTSPGDSARQRHRYDFAHPRQPVADPFTLQSGPLWTLGAELLGR